MKRFIYTVFSFALTLGSLSVMAKEDAGKPVKPAGFRTSEACKPSTASAELDINNVKALLHNGGDMWWDLVSNPRYEIPKGSKKHSMFAASLWLGGLDAAGQLRVAGQTYRQDGNDFWPGPLTPNTATVNSDICETWDKMYKITREEINAFRADFALNGANTDLGKYPNLKGWPGNGTDADGNNVEAIGLDGKRFFMAPFVDVGGDPNKYEPSAGDYPDFKGDQGIWWIINDKGNVHTATAGSQPIGIEIHMLAFGFQTSNAVNDMTFYDQLVINRSSITLNQTYLGQWADADLGNAADDYVGCDTLKGLGFCYNGDNNDEGATGYGLNPPAIGIDFFQGPVADLNDGIDNDKDGSIDEAGGELISMSKFVYYNNDWSFIGNPENAQHFYNYLRGYWKDGTQMVANNKNGYAPTAAGAPTNYMFTGDVCPPSGGWNETSAGNTAADRRFIQSAGPFTLQPGAVNEVITGVVWARGGTNLESVCLLQEADEIAQILFDKNFELLKGPDAPTVSAAEYDQEIVLSWTNQGNSNNIDESYLQADPVLAAKNVADSVFSFEGYMVYQLKDNTVSLSELSDPDRARLIGQCDIVNNISAIINRSKSTVNGQEVITDEVMVQGANSGLFHSLRVKEDVFTNAQFRNLVNYTPYYFGVIAYAYNDSTTDGRKFVPGNNGFRVIKATPHKVEMENDGTNLNSAYNISVPVTQVGGIGNGGNYVKITPETEASILQNGSVSEIGYQAGYAPVTVRVVDPKLVTGVDYRLEVYTNAYKFIETETIYGNVVDSVFAEWELFEGSTSVYASKFRKRTGDNTLRPAPMQGSEQVIPGRGIAITVKDAGLTGDVNLPNSGFIASDVVFSNPSKAWLSGLADLDKPALGGLWNWILAGPKAEDGERLTSDDNPPLLISDRNEATEKLAGGSWAPFCMARSIPSNRQGSEVSTGLPIGETTNGTRLGYEDMVDLYKLPDVDIVFTSDISKWSRCIVVETTSDYLIGSGASLLSGKWASNVDKQGASETSAPQSNNHGLGWFPGYAIDVNTGQRLALFFGENTFDVSNNGNDMKFNPTSEFGTALERAGGRHYVYVMKTPYTESLVDTFWRPMMNETTQPVSPVLLWMNDASVPGGVSKMTDIYNNVAWCGIPMANTELGFEDPKDMPSDVKISLRVQRPFVSRPNTTDNPTFTFSTKDVAVEKEVNETAVSMLDQILAVPNPYYGFSSYEESQLQNVIKLTNLPQECTINIYSLNGHLIRTYNKNTDSPELRWDLKNQTGVSVASGMYVAYINAPGIGETVVKMVVILRPTDLNSY